MVVHRAQFEATIRSVWLTYSASEADVAKLASDLNAESEQAAKNSPSVVAMMDALAGKAPSQALEALGRIRSNSWRPMTSYAHAGIHAISRHREGHPVSLLHAILKNTNGLAVLGYFQLVGICGRQAMQREILALAEPFFACLPDMTS